MSRTFHVKNFEKFQHYKDRNPPWIKLYNELLDDYEFACLQDASKLHLILIWLLASRSNNILPLDTNWIAKRINATSKVDLDALVRSGFIVINQELRSMEHIDINSLADCKQDARPETERETEKDITHSQKNGSVQGFELFWHAYPRREGKKAAEKAFRKAVSETTVDAILTAVEQQKPKWKDPKFIPHPATWLNRGQWADELSTQTQGNPWR